jgi:hypothetical protein
VSQAIGLNKSEDLEESEGLEGSESLEGSKLGFGGLSSCVSIVGKGLTLRDSISLLNLSPLTDFSLFS